MRYLAPAIAATALALGAYALWGLAVALLLAIGAPSMVAILVPIFALLYCSARW
jgi:hypothetical protein